MRGNVQESPVRFLLEIFGQMHIITILSSISFDVHGSVKILKIQAKKILRENPNQTMEICPIHFRNFTRTSASEDSEKMVKCPKYARKFWIFLDANLL